MVKVKPENGALVMVCVDVGTVRPPLCCLQCSHNIPALEFLQHSWSFQWGGASLGEGPHFKVKMISIFCLELKKSYNDPVK